MKKSQDDPQQGKIHLTKAQRRMLHEAATEGVVNRQDERRHKTFLALVDHGLLVYIKNQGWGLTQAGGELAQELFDAAPLVLSDPFRGDRCGVSQEAFEAALDYFDAWKTARNSTEESRRVGQAETREHLVARQVFDALQDKGLTPSGQPSVRRATHTHDEGPLCGFEVSVEVECSTRTRTEDRFLYRRSAFLTTQEELDTFIRILLSALDAILVPIYEPPTEEA